MLFFKATLVLGPTVEFLIRTMLAANMGLYFGLSRSEQRLGVCSKGEDV